MSKKTTGSGTPVEIFETSIQGRVVMLKNGVQLQATYQYEYTPEMMAVKMNAPGNSSQLMDKQKTGAASFKYSCYTLQGGYIFCNVANSATGAEGGSMGLEQYFVQHRTQLWLFKHGVVLAASMIITLGTQALTAGIFKTEYAVLVMTGLNMLNDKLKLLDPEKYWPGFGAGVEDVATRRKR